jgi:hypothetical protein
MSALLLLSTEAISAEESRLVAGPILAPGLPAPGWMSDHLASWVSDHPSAYDAACRTDAVENELQYLQRLVERDQELRDTARAQLMHAVVDGESSAKRHTDIAVDALLPLDGEITDLDRLLIRLTALPACTSGMAALSAPAAPQRRASPPAAVSPPAASTPAPPQQPPPASPKETPAPPASNQAAAAPVPPAAPPPPKASAEPAAPPPHPAAATPAPPPAQSAAAPVPPPSAPTPAPAPSAPADNAAAAPPAAAPEKAVPNRSAADKPAEKPAADDKAAGDKTAVDKPAAAPRDKNLVMVRFDKKVPGLTPLSIRRLDGALAALDAGKDVQIGIEGCENSETLPEGADCAALVRRLKRILADRGVDHPEELISIPR